jgi:chemotaxis protein MotB
MSRKKEKEHVNHERWMVSYADFVTLLFAFFVVMFASSQADKNKLAGVAQAIQSAFNKDAIFDVHSSKPPLDDKAPISPPAAVAALSEKSDGDSGLDQVRQALESALAHEIAAKSVVIRQSDNGLIVSLREAGFFPSGSAEIRNQSMPALNKIGQALAMTKDEVRIEGHTDNVPIHTALFESNWELSTARASRIARYFLDLPGTDARRFSAAGYAEYHPVASNSTEAGRMQNRRVDIVLLPSTGKPRPEEPTILASITRPSTSQ